MAHFIGYLQGNRGDVSRLGTKDSGIVAKAQGWTIGGRVACSVEKISERPSVEKKVLADQAGEFDEVDLYVTGGSGYSPSLYLGSFAIGKAGKIVRTRKGDKLA